VAAVGTTSDYCFGVAGRRIRLQFAGEALCQPMTRAFAHLADGSTGPVDLSVGLWETQDTGVAPPAPPIPLGRLLPRGEFPWPISQGFRVSYQVGSGVLCLFDERRRQAVVWVRDADQLPPWETAAPLRGLLHWWSQTFSGQLAHAAVVGDERGGVLLAGVGGSGKSSAALASVDAGLSYLGDDYVLLACGEHVEAHGIYGSAKVNAAYLHRAFPHWTDRTSGMTDDGKSVLFVNELVDRQLLSSLRIRAVLLPQVCGRRETVAVPASAAESLRALAPTTVCQLPYGQGQTLQALGAVCRKLPAYFLRLGQDTSSVAAAISEILRRHGRHET
jgi:hypothetical protein